MDLLLREREGGIKGDTQVSGLGNQVDFDTIPQVTYKRRKKLDFEGENKNRDGTEGGSFWLLLFCYFLVGKARAHFRAN